jgi:hypothetical protein
MAARAPRSTRKVVGVTAALAVLLVSLLFKGSSASAAEANVGLGTATSFAVLAGSTVTNTGPSTVAGDLGVSPGTAVTGFPPGQVSDGTIHAADAVAANAQADVTTAYNDAAGRSSTGAITADLAGQTLVGGVYTGPTLDLTGTLTLDAEGDPEAVFIFQAGSTLITGSGSSVALINGASACNVIWQVGSSATLGTNSDLMGTVLALTSITLDTGAEVSGRVLARNGAVTLDSNTITRPICEVPTTTTSTTAASTSTTEGSTSTTEPTTSTSTSTSTPGSTSSTVPGSTSTSPPILTTTTVAATSSTTSPNATSTTSSSIPGTSSTTSPNATSTTSSSIPGTSSTTSPNATSTTSSSIPGTSSSTSTTAPAASTSSTTAPNATSSTTPGPSSTSTSPLREFETTTTVAIVRNEGSTTVPGDRGSSTTTTPATVTSNDSFDSGPSLPRTGSSTGTLAVVGWALFATGAALLLAVRRRASLRS